MLSRTLNLVAALSLAIVSLAAHAARDVWPGDDWETATPESQGMSSRALAELLTWASFAHVDSLVVTRHGRIVTEAYYAPYDAAMKHRINSATKAFVGSLVGIAAAEGLLDPQGGALVQLGESSTDPARRAITLQHLIDMTSGIEWHEPLTSDFPRSLVAMERSSHWVRYVLDQPMASAPGTEFNYNSGNSQLASAIVARKTGMSTREFAVRRLLDPIGIRDFRWREDPQGVNTGAMGLYMHTRDMARYGYLYLNHGEWNGRPVVPRAWVDKVFDAKVPMHPMAQWRYADGWWTLPSKEAYLAVGYARQLIVVLPRQRVVAAFTGRAGYAFEDVIDKLVGAVRSDEAIAPDDSAHALLQAEVRKAATPPAPAHAKDASPPQSHTFRFEPNPARLRAVTIDFTGAGRYELQWEDAPEPQVRPLGLQGWSAAAPWRGEVAYSRSQWLGPRKLEVAVRWPEEARDQLFLLEFGDRTLDVKFTPANGKPVRMSAVAQ
ncbi:MAG TPA: serine hydrolase [Ramlibacter sp.]|uniref:serine hydrolase domain-containing protein n=1 Tax=Ramlibacter sp. TaxID=1917967 RepID=UPI002C44C0D5|nr:serine hydrolase [Ramlibacter sp.]HVZ45460.1 serine hydrolase [Ramlibacter sp.]